MAIFFKTILLFALIMVRVAKLDKYRQMSGRGCTDPRIFGVYLNYSRGKEVNKPEAQLWTIYPSLYHITIHDNI
ncbi:hypothetical protein DXN04_08240 [Chitinophaga silvisoli]|uniref:Uncharacterized protein n=1 Tax=Chitinophaga silvisoli TaxID=2291814 RepID=A0A3E1P596_9BACT|nr:hypothetical protein DXN04_08240 [Chitinophaga silvisoli]